MEKVYRCDCPAIVFHPGHHLEEKISEMGLDANDLATRMGYSPKAVLDILQGRVRITPDSAYLLEMVTAIPSSFWLRSQIAYDEFKAQKYAEDFLGNQPMWKKAFPEEASARDWIAKAPKGADTKESIANGITSILKFFAVGSPQAWENYYKEARLKIAFNVSLAETKDPYALSMWIRRGEILSDRDPMEKIDHKDVRKNIKATLPEIVAFAAAHKVLPENAKKITYTTPEAEVVDECMTGLAELCRNIGIRVLFVQNFKSAPVQGMYRWYKDVPLIQLHDRFKKRESMWFTFFHELAHALYHGKKGICLQNIEITHPHPEKEDEANCFAQKCLADAGF